MRVKRRDDEALPAPVYANHLQVTFTPEDFTLFLGWYAMPALLDPPPEGQLEVPVEPVARVVVPLNLMRNVIAALQRSVENYEENFGPLPEHPNPPAWMQQLESK